MRKAVCLFFSVISFQKRQSLSYIEFIKHLLHTLQKTLPVAHGPYPFVADDDPSCVGLRSDKSAESLLELKHSAGQGVFGKGISSCLFYLLCACYDHRFCRHLKR